MTRIPQWMMSCTVNNHLVLISHTLEDLLHRLTVKFCKNTAWAKNTECLNPELCSITFPVNLIVWWFGVGPGAAYWIPWDHLQHLSKKEKNILHIRNWIWVRKTGSHFYDWKKKKKITVCIYSIINAVYICIIPPSFCWMKIKPKIIMKPKWGSVSWKRRAIKHLLGNFNTLLYWGLVRGKQF